MSTSRRQFIVGTAAGLILPSYFDKVFTYMKTKKQIEQANRMYHLGRSFALNHSLMNAKNSEERNRIWAAHRAAKAKYLRKNETP